MLFTRHSVEFGGAQWAADGQALPADFTLTQILKLPASEIAAFLATRNEPPLGRLLPPVEESQEVWASGVTYLRSRVEREAESTVADIYARVYEAERPEIFFKSVGWRVRGPNEPVRIRRDSAWNVPEPELTLVIDSSMEIVGYTVGNDMSSRSIEGENPLYLPQAKTYDGSCALGPGIVKSNAAQVENLPITIKITRGGEEVFAGEASTSQMKRTPLELVEFLGRELSFPNGVFLMTGTGIVPTSDFTLASRDEITITVGEITLVNAVE